MKSILLLLLALLTLSPSSVGEDNLSLYKFQVTRNDEIDEAVSQRIKEVDTSLIQALINQDIDGFSEICSSYLEESMDDLEKEQFIDSISGILKDDTINYLDKYHVEFSQADGSGATIYHLDDDALILMIDAVSKNVYVSLLIFDNEPGNIVYSNYYIEEEGELKLYSSHFANYDLFGMNAIDYYEKAKSFDSQGETIPAYIYATTGYDIIELAPFIEYKGKAEMLDFYNSIQEKYEAIFSNKDLININENNMIFSFQQIYTNVDYAVKVNYLTDLTLSENNATEIELEAEAIDQYVCANFAGFEGAFDNYIYTAFNELPIDPDKMYIYYSSLFTKGR